MPSLFPELFTYAFLVTGVLRMTLGLIFIWLAYKKFFRERAEGIVFFENLRMRPAIVFVAIVSGVEAIAGVALVAGFYTQVAVLVTGGFMTLATLIKFYRPSALPRNTAEFYILLAVVSFTILFLGPGAFAFDLPL